MRRVRFRWWTFITLLLVLSCAISAALYLRPYSPDSVALAQMESRDDVTVDATSDWIAFTPDQPSGLNILFYPGAMVAPESYAPLAAELARNGHPVYIVRMPFDLAVFGINNALKVIDAHQNERFVIGGHSLGGVMAARFATKHRSLVEGIFFLAAYPDAKGSLIDKGLPALSIIGSNDGKIDWAAYESAARFLPQPLTRYMTIEGGNHSQFGSYGLQNGDNPATISAQQQRAKTVAAISQWLDKAVNRMPTGAIRNE